MTPTSTPPVGVSVAGPAGAIYAQALDALASIREAAGQLERLDQVRSDITEWNRFGSTAQHRARYGGTGSLNDVLLAEFAEISEDRVVWVNAALDAASNVAVSSAESAENGPANVLRVAPGFISGRKFGLQGARCRACDRYFTDQNAIDDSAATGWSSYFVAGLLNSGHGRDVASAALDSVHERVRRSYVDFVETVADANQFIRTGLRVSPFPAALPRVWRAGLGTGERVPVVTSLISAQDLVSCIVSCRTC
jgi:hypothetical protein